MPVTPSVLQRLGHRFDAMRLDDGGDEMHRDRLLSSPDADRRVTLGTSWAADASDLAARDRRVAHVGELGVIRRRAVLDDVETLELVLLARCAARRVALTPYMTTQRDGERRHAQMTTLPKIWNCSWWKPPP